MRRAAVCVEFSPGELVQRWSFFNYLAITTYWGMSAPWGGGRRTDLWPDCFKQNQKPKQSTTILCCCISVESNFFFLDFFFFFLRKRNRNTPASKNI